MTDRTPTQEAAPRQLYDVETIRRAATCAMDSVEAGDAIVSYLQLYTTPASAVPDGAADDPFTALPDEPHIEGGVHHPYSAYNQGHDAGLQTFERNPYEAGTREHHWWAQGCRESIAPEALPNCEHCDDQPDVGCEYCTPALDPASNETQGLAADPYEMTRDEWIAYAKAREDELLKITALFHEHPEDHNGPCDCGECREAGS